MARLQRVQGPEGRPPNVSPARKGWEIDREEDPSAVGAALNRCAIGSEAEGSAVQYFGTNERSLLFRGPFLEMFFDRVCGVEPVLYAKTDPRMLLPGTIMEP
jgi:hypothetical protein